MQPIPVTVGEETLLVPRLKVQQIIDLAVLRHERDRRDLLRDLEDANVPSEDRMAMLKEQREQAGLSSVVVRSAFSVDGSFAIIRTAMGGEFPDLFQHLDPGRLSSIALGCLGLDLDEMAEEADDAKVDAEGNERTETATG